jgi:hypothetical protein
MSVIFINPYRFAVPWTPANITTALWLDAADASTITASSGAVSEWRDKSGNARHASQATAGNRPATGSATLNGLNVIRYDATDDFLSLTNTSGLTTATAFYFFGVRRSSVAAAADTVTSRSFLTGVGGTYSIGVDASILLSQETTLLLTGPDNTTAPQGQGNPRVGANAANYARSANAAELYDISGTNTADVTAKVNGSAIGSYLTAATANRSDPSFCNPALTGFNIGGSGGASNGAIVDFAELIVITSAPTADTISRPEGYRAHKWGLTASLPANHPYKSVPPTL